MARLQTRYLCQSCGYESLKWMGRCPQCEAWDSFVEDVVMRERPSGGSTLARQPDRTSARGFVPPGSGAPVPITQVEAAAHTRLTTGVGEFDRVLGGGLVPGGVVLVGGDPGIGKSTLLTQVAANVATALSPPFNALYVSGEESAHQIKLRCSRIGGESDRLLVSVETEIELVLRHLEATAPALAVIDSIQTMSESAMDSAAGSVSQVRACAAHLARFAKSAGVPIVIIGHVTKEGNLAGPRVLEHIVDTVLYFEGDRHHAYRLLRAVKNRFGSTDELGIFEMQENGLVGVENPSAVLLAERPADGIGSAVTAALEGSRALLVEVQALVARSNLPSPRRAVTGMDPNRVNMILAVLEKRVGLRIAEQDAYVNVTGGIRVTEPAADLAAAVAVASSFREQSVHPTCAILGEVGLAGEVRAVSQPERRIREAARQGFTKVILSRHDSRRIAPISGIEVVGVASVTEALDAALLPATSSPQQKSPRQNQPEAQQP